MTTSSIQLSSQTYIYPITQANPLVRDNEVPSQEEILKFLDELNKSPLHETIPKEIMDQASTNPIPGLYNYSGCDSWINALLQAFTFIPSLDLMLFETRQMLGILGKEQELMDALDIILSQINRHKEDRKEKISLSLSNTWCLRIALGTLFQDKEFAANQEPFIYALQQVSELHHELKVEMNDTHRVLYPQMELIESFVPSGHAIPIEEFLFSTPHAKTAMTTTEEVIRYCKKDGCFFSLYSNKVPQTSPLLLSIHPNSRWGFIKDEMEKYHSLKRFFPEEHPFFFRSVSRQTPLGSYFKKWPLHLKDLFLRNWLCIEHPREISRYFFDPKYPVNEEGRLVVREFKSKYQRKHFHLPPKELFLHVVRLNKYIEHGRPIPILMRKEVSNQTGVRQSIFIDFPAPLFEKITFERSIHFDEECSYELMSFATQLDPQAHVYVFYQKIGLSWYECADAKTARVAKHHIDTLLAKASFCYYQKSSAVDVSFYVLKKQLWLKSSSFYRRFFLQNFIYYDFKPFTALTVSLIHKFSLLESESFTEPNYKLEIIKLRSNLRWIQQVVEGIATAPPSSNTLGSLAYLLHIISNYSESIGFFKFKLQNDICILNDPCPPTLFAFGKSLAEQLKNYLRFEILFFQQLDCKNMLSNKWIPRQDQRLVFIELIAQFHLRLQYQTNHESHFKDLIGQKSSESDAIITTSLLDEQNWDLHDLVLRDANYDEIREFYRAVNKLKNNYLNHEHIPLTVCPQPTRSQLEKLLNLSREKEKYKDMAIRDLEYLTLHIKDKESHPRLLQIKSFTSRFLRQKFTNYKIAQTQAIRQCNELSSQQQNALLTFHQLL
ncbi:MAG: hypothetical protein EBZ47_01445 [Chlamydiae bacterium]|nr:hypothetical protein [Chlamydiota bacterium]